MFQVQKPAEPKFQAKYDVFSDLMYVSFGKPRPAFTEKVGDLLFRYDRDTHNPSGVTVLNYSNWHVNLHSVICFFRNNKLTVSNEELVELKEVMERAVENGRKPPVV